MFAAADRMDRFISYLTDARAIVMYANPAPRLRKLYGVPAHASCQRHDGNLESQRC